MGIPYVRQIHAAAVVLDLGVAAFALGELSQALRWRRGASRPEVLAEVIFRVVFLAGNVVLPFSRLAPPRADIGGAVVLVIGRVLGWGGLLLRWWSFVTLGSYFSTVVRTSADQRVVDRGPYRVLRHPSYTGLLLAALGDADATFANSRARLVPFVW